MSLMISGAVIFKPPADGFSMMVRFSNVALHKKAERNEQNAVRAIDIYGLFIQDDGTINLDLFERRGDIGTFIYGKGKSGATNAYTGQCHILRDVDRWSYLDEIADRVSKAERDRHMDELKK
uniref:Uncharacterized protein n=1 Tax=Timema douglasi TaxID=61478 RepID=A0A7R8ZAU4_TIMDO|nr:unnamed protein product [Timema douglasi]